MTIQAEIYENNTTTYTKSVYQHDKNVTLVFDGIDLPEQYEVHFSNEKDSGISVACKGAINGVLIPNELLSTGRYVYAWVVGTPNDSDRDAKFMVVIPVIPRPVPIPVQIIEESTEPAEWKFEVSADDENLTFVNAPDGMLTPVLDVDP